MMLKPTDYKILVIDHDLESAVVMIDHLRACGFRVVGAKTAAMILKKALQEAPSLIVIDLMSPGREGLKVCKELTANPSTHHIPIIMVTAENDETDKIVAFELGVDDYVVKPFNLHELSLRIERSLERAGLRHENLDPHPVNLEHP